MNTIDSLIANSDQFKFWNVNQRLIHSIESI